MVLDTMENLSSSKYAALPERLYILQRGKVIYKVKNINNNNEHNIDSFKFQNNLRIFTFNSAFHYVSELVISQFTVSGEKRTCSKTSLGLYKVHI